MITPLHVRSGYSFCRGVALPDRLVNVAARLGHGALAMTDVNNLCGATVFWKKAAAAGISPIIGAELLDGGLSVVALCADETGYENLCRLITRIHCGRGEGENLIDDLAELSDGLELLVDAPSAAGALARRLGRRLWVAIDPFGPDEMHNLRLMDCAESLGLRPVVSGRALLAEEGDIEAAKLLAAIRTGRTLDSVEGGAIPPRSSFLRPGEQIRLAAAQFASAIDNNMLLARRCSCFKLLPRSPVFPDFACPAGTDARSYLRRLCVEGLGRRYDADMLPRALARMDSELAVIQRMGFSAYFLVVWDIVQYARRRGAPVAGRGSGASSIVAYSLGITNVCPLRHAIPFERFLHEGREDFPDLDVDFCWRLRDEVIDYAFKRWGVDHVAMVSMHGTFQARSALRETAKAMGYSDSQISRMDELIDDADGGAHAPAAIARLAGKIIDLPHNLSVHPGGIVIGPKPIDHYAPIQPAHKGVNITQYDKNGVEDIQLVKLDLLGNRNLSTVRYAIDLIRAGGQEIDIETIPCDDAATVGLLQRADTVGCNQLESPAMRRLLRMMQPRNAAGVMQALAMIRPGAAGIGMKETFIRRLRGLEPVEPPPPQVAGVLDDTLGIMLYEDDVLSMAAAMLGIPMAKADRFRRSVQKCRDDRARLELSREFLAGCRANGLDLDYAKGIWVQMAKFNAYSFCRAHAASYGLLAYAGAYLRTHYPLEFWVSALNNNQSMYPHRVYVEQAKRDGIKFLLPDVNRSLAEFAIEDGAARIGLDRVSGLGPVGVQEIINCRSRAPFEGLSDFLSRTSIGEQEARSLILCGAFDWTGRSRPMLMMELNLFHRIGPRRLKGGATLLPALPTLPHAPGDYSPHRKYFDERTILGLTPGPHIMKVWRSIMTNETDADSRDLPRLNGRRVKIAGVVEARRPVTTQRGQTMVFATFDDEWGLFEATIFPDAMARMDASFDRYGPYVISGQVEEQYDAVTISADAISLFQPSAAGACH